LLQIFITKLFLQDHRDYTHQQLQCIYIMLLLQTKVNNWCKIQSDLCLVLQEVHEVSGSNVNVDNGSTVLNDRLQHLAVTVTSTAYHTQTLSPTNNIWWIIPQSTHKINSTTIHSDLECKLGNMWVFVLDLFPDVLQSIRRPVLTAIHQQTLKPKATGFTST